MKLGRERDSRDIERWFLKWRTITGHSITAYSGVSYGAIHDVDMLATASTVMATNMPPSRSSSEFCSLFPSSRITCFLHAISAYSLV